jgi:hypothetical protein
LIHTIKRICSRGVWIGEHGLMIGGDKGGLLVVEERGGAILPVVSHIREGCPSDGVLLRGTCGSRLGRGWLELGPVA